MTGDQAAAVARVRGAVPLLTQRALARLTDLAWFTTLDADVRSWIGLVVSTALLSLSDWLEDPTASTSASERAFSAVPRAAARAVSLEQTVEMIRVCVEAVLDAVAELADGSAEVWLRSRAEQYARELAFSAALIYARVAEQRGGWEARLQARVIHALLDGDDPRVVESRAAALGATDDGPVHAIAFLPSGDTEAALEHVQGNARRLRLHLLAAVHGQLVVAVIPASGDPCQTAQVLLGEATAAVVGAEAADLTSAGESARAAVAGAQVLSAWPGHPTPVYADVLLAERALAGDPLALRKLVTGCYDPLVAAGPAMLDSVDAVLTHGRSLEAAARSVHAHVNTLRYRLARVAELTGYDPRDPRDGFTLRVALVLGRVSPGSPPVDTDAG
ncbi:MAG: PucR family transcriptional regulator [Mycobacteriales bacterium]